MSAAPNMAISPRLKLGFLASRNGTSFRAILRAIEVGELAADALMVVSNNRKAGALIHAAEHGVPTHHIPTQADPVRADAELTQVMSEAVVELIVLSGYLRRLGPVTLSHYRGGILNVHPSLLPAFGGEGMYGRRVHEAVIAAGVRESGATIHLVDEVYDHGAVVRQRALPVHLGETVDQLEARVAALEPELFVETIKQIAAGSLVLAG